MNILVKFKDELIDALNEYKKWIIMMYALFFIIFFVVVFFYAPQFAGTIKAMIANAGTQEVEIVNPLDLLRNNLTVIFVMYFASILFGLGAIGGAIYNAVNAGLASAIFSVKMSNGVMYYLVYLIPHGIFEISSFLLSGVAGLVLFKFFWNFLKTFRKSGGESRVSYSYNENKQILIHSVVILIFSVILMIIAAPIESYISVPFANLIVGV